MNKNTDLPLITIVVPIYNVAKYLNKCVDSLLNQTYDNLEIILVNDGSSDNCGNICDFYKKRDFRITVIHKTNGGLSDARNAGIEIAKGTYIAFVDSDDYVKADYIEKLFRGIEEHCAEVAVCSFELISETGKVIGIEEVAKEKICISGRRLLQKVLTPYGGRYVIACNKLYKADIFKRLRFKEGKLYEDEYINFRLFWDCKKVALVPDRLYCYLQRQGSIQRTPLTLDKIDMKRGVHFERIAFYEIKQAESLYRRSVQMYCNWLVNCFMDSFDILDKKHKIDFQQDMRRYVPMIFMSPEVSRGEKAQDLLGYLNLKLAGKVKKHVMKNI